MKHVNQKQIRSSVAGRRLLTEREAAEYLGICPRTLFSLEARGEIQAVRLGRAKRYDIWDLDQLIEQQKGKQRPHHGQTASEAAGDPEGPHGVS